MQKSNNKPYDVAVVGAGPAGLSVALECSQKGLSVLLIEESPLSETEKSWITFKETIKDYPFIKEAITNTVNRLKFCGPQACFDSEKTSLKGYIVEQALMNKEFKAALKKNKTCDILDKTVYQKAERENDIVQIKTSQGLFKAKIAVDAGGSYSLLASHLKVPDHNPWLFMCYFLRVYKKGALNDCSCAAFSYGADEADSLGTAGALYPNCQQYFDIGIANYLRMGDDTSKMKSALKQQMANLWGFYQEQGLIKPAVKIDFRKEFYGAIRMQRRKHIVGNNIIVVGDAAGQGSPVTGEGLRTGLYYGKIASRVIVKAIKEKDYTENALNGYSDLCREKPLFGYGYGGFIQHLIRKKQVSGKPFSKMQRSYQKDKRFWLKYGLKVIKNKPLSFKEILRVLMRFSVS